MTANEDPAAQPNPEATGDKLEDWLSGLRTEVAADPSGWIGDEAPAERPATRAAERPAKRPAEHPAARPVEHPAARPVEHPATRPAERPAARPAEPTRIGRHRAEE